MKNAAAVFLPLAPRGLKILEDVSCCQQSSVYTQISSFPIQACSLAKPGAFTPIISNFLQNTLPQYTTHSEKIRNEANRLGVFFFRTRCSCCRFWQFFHPPIRPAGMGERGMFCVRLQQLQEDFSSARVVDKTVSLK